jgi:hypothetical protein
MTTHFTIRLADRKPVVRTIASKPTTTTILFDPTHAGHAAHATRRPFASGLFAFVPSSGRVGYTVQDENDYLAMVADRDRQEARDRRDAAAEFDAIMEEMAENSAMMDRACAGVMGF